MPMLPLITSVRMEAGEIRPHPARQGRGAHGLPLRVYRWIVPALLYQMAHEEQGPLPAEHHPDLPRHRLAHLAAGSLPGPGGLPGRAHHIRVRVQPGGARQDPAAERHLHEPVLHLHRHAARPGVHRPSPRARHRPDPAHHLPQGLHREPVHPGPGLPLPGDRPGRARPGPDRRVLLHPEPIGPGPRPHHAGLVPGSAGHLAAHHGIHPLRDQRLAGPGRHCGETAPASPDPVGPAASRHTAGRDGPAPHEGPPRRGRLRGQRQERVEGGIHGRHPLRGHRDEPGHGQDRAEKGRAHLLRRRHPGGHPEARLHPRGPRGGHPIPDVPSARRVTELVRR